ncbi:MAG: Uncharacterised protein [Methanobacteriota archaeon]|nr:MAG: Uncharacterised protein [Euryarchaeota archaeon]
MPGGGGGALVFSSLIFCPPLSAAMAAVTPSLTSV